MSEYEHMRGESGKAEIANLLDATKIRVWDALTFAQKTMEAMNGNSRAEKMARVIEKLQEAAAWVDKTLPGW